MNNYAIETTYYIPQRALPIAASRFHMRALKLPSRLFMQDAGDGDSATSDGFLVYAGDAPSVSAGDEVAVVGTASEYYNNTQISVSAPASDMVSFSPARHALVLLCTAAYRVFVPR